MKKVIFYGIIIFCVILEIVTFFIYFITGSNTHNANEQVLLVQQAQNELREIKNYGYVYSTLDADEKVMYSEILSVLDKIQTSCNISGPPEKISKIFSCVLADHPEIFWVDGYKYTVYKDAINDNISEVILSPNYTMSLEQVSLYIGKIAIEAGYLLSKIPDDADEYERVKIIYDYILNSTEYNSNIPNNQNICSVFLENQSVCQGYSKALQYLLNKEGIWCTIVTGMAAGEAHTWNLVRIDNEYYHIDATWSDNDKSSSAIAYEYFLIPTRDIEKTHIIDNIVEIPNCDSMNNNYYVREGLYIENWDEKIIPDVLTRYDDTSYVTLRCKNYYVYEQVRHNLLIEQKIFDYLKTDKIQYSENQELYILNLYIQ